MTRWVRLAIAFAVLSAGLAGCLLVSGVPSAFSLAFLYGLVLFGGNGILLAFAAERMLSDGEGRRWSPALGVGASIVAKVVVLGAGCYVGLVWLLLNPWALVGGAITALALLTIAVVTTGQTGGRKASSS